MCCRYLWSVPKLKVNWLVRAALCWYREGAPQVYCGGSETDRYVVDRELLARRVDKLDGTGVPPRLTRRAWRAVSDENRHLALPGARDESRRMIAIGVADQHLYRMRISLLSKGCTKPQYDTTAHDHQRHDSFRLHRDPSSLNDASALRRAR